MSMPKNTNYDVNVFRDYTYDQLELIREGIKKGIQDAIREFRPKYFPPSAWLDDFLGEDIRRLAALLDRAAATRKVSRKYVLIFQGASAQKAYRILETECANLPELKKVIESEKPEWALNCRALPLAEPVDDDQNYPLVMHWTQMKRPITEKITEMAELAPSTKKRKKRESNARTRTIPAKRRDFQFNIKNL